MLITGGIQGIGRSAAKKFLKNGDVLILASVNTESEVQSALRELNHLGEVSFIYTDVSNQNDCQKTVEMVLEKYYKIDVLVNAAGILGDVVPITEANLQKIHRVIEVDLMGSIFMTMYTAKAMTKRNGGVVVNLSSVCGQIAANDSLGYHAAKGGIEMATKVWAKELAPYGIRCVAVAPGAVRTPLLDAEWEAEGRKLHMRNQVIEVEDIAEIIYFLSSNAASAINGCTVMADDGYSAFKGIW